MQRDQIMSGRKRENGIVILLVAVVLLFVVGAMAALAIDAVTLFTARSEAQLAADGAALAGARVLANSGLTSTVAGPIGAEGLARTIATQVARGNDVGGRPLTGAEIVVTFPNDTTTTFLTNPHITVQTQRGDLPTFFARIWGKTALTVVASATAEAYNPSGMNAAGHTPVTPVAPLCVKPWLLANLDPTQPAGTGARIFDRTTGAIIAIGLVGQSWPNAIVALNQNGLYAQVLTAAPSEGQYYPGAIDAADFPVPTQATPACSTTFNPYQLAVAGCVPRPISCGATATINIDTAAYANRDADTVAAAECLIHYNGAVGDTDTIDTAALPFQFLPGNRNPVAGGAGKDILVSDSLVTIPVYDSNGSAPTNPVTVIGFLQVFLNPQGNIMPVNVNQIPATVINIVGCGINATGTPIQGNGASAVPVRLVSAP